MIQKSLGLVILLLAASPAPALAWGGQGHRMVGEEAIRALPETVPSFLRSQATVAAMGELSREPDRSKGAGKIHDSNRDPGHFVDLEEVDDGRLQSAQRLLDLVGG